MIRPGITILVIGLLIYMAGSVCIAIASRQEDINKKRGAAIVYLMGAAVTFAGFIVILIGAVIKFLA